MKNKFTNLHLAVILTALLFAIILYSSGQIVRNSKIALHQTDETSAQTGCNSSFFTVNSPSGWNFTKGCLQSNIVVYSTDTRFQFFQPSTTLNNAAVVKTPNSEIKDNTSLSWSINVTGNATLYIMPRHIPGILSPAWIRNNYTRQTNDDMSNINQYQLRKNEQGLVGLYDIYSRNVTGTVTLQGASDTSSQAYSMYLVALVPGTGTQTATPAPSSGTPSPSTSATPGPSGSQPPANLLTIAQQHVHPPTDCWALYHHATDGWHLYNLSDYFSVTIGTKVIKQHPGGDDDLTWACGKDITDVFNKGAKTMGVSGHGDKAHITKSSAMSKLKSLQVPGF